MTGGESDENNKTKLEPGSTNPAQRKGEDSDMAATVLLLASRGGTFYNEQILYPDVRDLFDLFCTSWSIC